MIDMHIEDARAGARKVAEIYEMKIYIWKLAPSGRYLMTNKDKAPYANAVLAETIIPPEVKPSGPAFDAGISLTSERVK